MTAEHQPTLFRGVMISSTFADLQEHRHAMVKALNDNELMHVAMENVGAIADADVINVSLAMVQKASAYILIIGQRYGQIPGNKLLNPNNLSITELEFLEAQRLGRPTLLFLMDISHPLSIKDIDFEPKKKKKLAAFRRRAIKWHADSDTSRVYREFNSLQDFAIGANSALSRLKDLLGSQKPDIAGALPSDLEVRPPALYANPRYLGSHAFIGRKDQIRIIDEWALPRDPHPALFLEAIGGTGKSILAWTWLFDRSSGLRTDWAGRFWYSFYERGAETRDFLLRALTYMHGGPLLGLDQRTNAQLASLFLSQSSARPWLFVLDGVERLLVDYNRFDAEYRSDDAAGTEDLIAARPPLAMVRDDDAQLFRALLAASPSKFLFTSRLLPRCMVNMAHQPLPGLLHQRLPGLSAEDAETLFRACKIEGDSSTIRRYLKETCDCHPLVIGILAGLINRFLPARGNFDLWKGASAGGLALSLAKLDLVSRRNHILRFALDALSQSSRELLATLALLLNEFDYKVLVALRRKDAADSESTLSNAITDLEEHGFLLFHRQSQLYDLHPVVRNVVIGSLAGDQKDRAGERVIDYFSTAADRPLRDAQKFEDVLPALHLVHTYLKLERFDQAWNAYSRVFDALWLNLELHDKNLAILRAFFVDEWESVHPKVSDEVKRFLFNYASVALRFAGFKEEALRCAMAYYLQHCAAGTSPSTAVSNLAHALFELGRMASAHRLWQSLLNLAQAECDDCSLFLAHMNLMRIEGALGRIDTAEEHWHQLDKLGRDWDVACYREGTAEYEHLRFLIDHEEVHPEALSDAEGIARQSPASRRTLRQLVRLRGLWHLSRSEFDLAGAALESAAAMARECGQRDAQSESALIRARFSQTPRVNALEEVTRLSAEPERADVELALLWELLGEPDKALSHARMACNEACADGEAWILRHQFETGRNIIRRLGGNAYQGMAATARTEWPTFIRGFPPMTQFLRDLDDLTQKLRITNKDNILRHMNTPMAERRRLRSARSVVLYRALSKDGVDFYAYIRCSEAQYFRMESDFQTKTSCKNARDYGEVLYTRLGKEPDAEADAFLEAYLRNM